MTTAATVDCPLCTVTVLGHGADETESANAAIGGLEDHLAQHFPGTLASPREDSRTLDPHETDRNTI
ncbi:hypothetical protein [Micromonospora cathayae]|uniref:Uncharacterized protein n=1 Tax=Micromonospora cathayae TaxID=3028804 RepID=A0ABY7ZXN3_9ACTN|nr:hypothetical protein [Micromonospora sp. HUAS 3]WDZ87213.1 hypothetical protein PVK37_12795 [Micromonospora sp. HUAS 3]